MASSPVEGITAYGWDEKKNEVSAVLDKVNRVSFYIAPSRLIEVCLYVAENEKQDHFSLISFTNPRMQKYIKNETHRITSFLSSMNSSRELKEVGNIKDISDIFFLNKNFSDNILRQSDDFGSIPSNITLENKNAIAYLSKDYYANAVLLAIDAKKNIENVGSVKYCNGIKPLMQKIISIH